MVEGIKKVGEGTFSEVFGYSFGYSDEKGTQLVMKVSNSADKSPSLFPQIIPIAVQRSAIVPLH